MADKTNSPGETPDPRKAERSEAARGGGVSPGAAPPDPEMTPRAKRRRFSAAYKLRIVQEADDSPPQSGEVGALLRREGLYSSQLGEWRRARDQGQLESLAPARRGPKRDPDAALKKRCAQLEREVVGLRSKLETAETILEVQGNVSRLLGLTMPKSESDS